MKLDEIFGVNTEKAYQRSLKGHKKQKKSKQPTEKSPFSNTQDVGEYIILPGRTHGNDYYPDILVAMETSKDTTNWNKAHEILHQEGAFMLTIRQFIDFIELLKSGKAYNEKGKRVNGATLNKIMDEIMGKGYSGSGEWLDAKFSKAANLVKALYIEYNHRIIDNKLQAQKSEKLEPHLEKSYDRYIELSSCNRQGLPTKKSNNQEISYNPPRAAGVAASGASRGWEFLHCDSIPSHSMNIRAAKVREPRKLKQSVVKPIPNDIREPADYIVLPAKTHDTYSYPDILVATEISHHDKDWHQARKALHQEGAFMLTIRQFIDFIELLRSGEAYNEKGKKIDKSTLDDILAEILTAKPPSRAEWLDAKFRKESRRLTSVWKMTYHRIKNGKLEEVTEYLEKKYLMKDKLPGIKLNYWLANATSQGLPPKKIPKGGSGYMHPKDDCVAVFRTSPESYKVVDRYLRCNADPEFTHSTLGVRAAKIKA